MKGAAPRWENPLAGRYASAEMLRIVSDDFKYVSWRRLWIALAEAQSRLGLPISQRQVSALKKRRNDLNYKAVARWEKRLRHDVMSHLRVYGEQCPSAKGILHLGATSAYVTDNADLFVLREGLRLVEARLTETLRLLAAFAKKHRAEPALAYTHFQTAQPTTVGKRACLWMQDLMLDGERLAHVLSQIRFLGVKGTTGTQASFLSLFNGNAAKVKKLDAMVARAMGFENSFPVTGQTYPRKMDSLAADALAGLAQSASKFAADMRLLQGLGEMEEPFEAEQVGSSAMPYKRNPMRCERMASLSRFVMSLSSSPAHTAANQWLERTLDDSANRRLVIPQMLLACDAILLLYANVASGMKVNREVIRRRLAEEAPFMATEGILMAASKRGGDRQELHERLRRHAMEVRLRLRRGESADLAASIAADRAFGLPEREVRRLADPVRMTGLAPQQVDDFLRGEAAAFLKKRAGLRAAKGQIKV